MLGRVLAISCTFWAFLCGLWLALSPFVLGPKPIGGQWDKVAIVEVTTGSSIAVVAIFTIIALLKSLTGILRADGYLQQPVVNVIVATEKVSNEDIAAPQEPQRAEVPLPTPVPSSPESTVDLPVDANALLTPLVTALAEDLAQRPGGSGEPASPIFPPNVPADAKPQPNAAERN